MKVKDIWNKISDIFFVTETADDDEPETSEPPIEEVEDIPFRDFDLSKTTVRETVAPKPVSTTESGSRNVPFTIPTVQSKPVEKPKPAPIPQPKPISSTEKQTDTQYEFIRVISPVFGLKDGEQERPIRQPISKNTNNRSVSPIGTVLSPTNGIYNQTELHGEEVEDEWKHMKVNDFLEVSDDDEPKQPEKAEAAPKTAAEPSRAAMHAEQADNGIVNMSLFDDEYK